MTTCEVDTLMAGMSISSMEQFFRRTVLPAIARTKASGGTCVYVACVAPADLADLQRLAWQHQCFCVPAQQQVQSLPRQRTLDACSYELRWDMQRVCAN
jgi:hypothetical protein